MNAFEVLPSPRCPTSKQVRELRPAAELPADGSEIDLPSRVGPDNWRRYRWKPPRRRSRFSSTCTRAITNVIDREVSVLSSSKNGYLSANDWALLVDKASRVCLKKGEALVQKARKRMAFIFCSKERPEYKSLSNKAPAIGPGEICGEMSLLEDVAASATVFAEEEIEAYHLDHPTLETLFELFPHLASRFYRSLARNLSRRLGELIAPSSESRADV